MGSPLPLASWCHDAGVAHAIVGGFFVRQGDGTPLGELWRRGQRVHSVPFDEPWDATRSCVAIDDDQVTLAPRDDLPDQPRGDLLQVGPLLVAGRRPVVHDELDPEGFSANQNQFDSDITVGRYPRCALGVGDGELLAVCCDGRRSGVDAGLELAELARLMLSFGAHEAINLDGGGSATLVHRGHLLNRPYSEEDQPAPESRPVVTALLFDELPSV
jgi:phosphodiester glycosidase